MKQLAKVIAIVMVCLVSNSQNSNRKTLIEKVEENILLNQRDSVDFYIKKIKSSNYKSILDRINVAKIKSYNDYKVFINNVSNNDKFIYNLISDFINERVKEPTKNSINVTYCQIKYNQISRLRNNGDLDKSSEINNDLIKYISKFPNNDPKVQIQKSYANIHDAVLLYIQNDIVACKEILDRNIQTAKKNNDVELQIASMFYMSDILVEQQKLNEFIALNEKILSLEKSLPKNTQYYSGTIEHLINAYAYKGVNDERIQELLLILYNNLDTKKNSYSLYAQYLSSLPKESETKQNIYKQFGVTNALEFTDLIIKESKGLLNNNDFYYVLIESSALLERDGYLKEAIRKQEEAVLLTRKIYSTELSTSLANFKTRQAVKEKEQEIAFANERSELYSITAILIGIFLSVALYFLIRFIKQSRLLKKKNNQIELALKEKELLIKEVHHRVKNNFQIVSSLLELQSKDIKDEKAKALADEGKNRVKSMAIIHQKLYQNENGLIDIKEYVNDLIREIRALSQISKEVIINSEIDDIHLDVDTAIPLGLIINEIITNAFKYAFTKTEAPELHIGIKKNDHIYQLEVNDNGPALVEKFNLKASKTLGTRLIKRLTKQLQGSVILNTDNGFKYDITFKDTFQRKHID